jgi:pyruvate/2-oxoglutarate dehydrogenase complex dihydrolipoamide acyltransferase (E2) component
MDVVMPDLGDSSTEAVVAQWRCKVGDAVQAGEVLAEAETNKTTLEVVAPVSGVLSEILVEEGDGARSGARLGVISPAS